MNRIITKLFVLGFIILNISACSKEPVLCNDFLRGLWVIRDWTPGTNGSGDLIYTYDAETNEMILSIVPTNSFGFEPGEVNIRNIDVNNDESFEAEIKLRYGNGDFEWIKVDMMVENDDLIKTKMDCSGCDDLGSLERL